MSDAAHEYIFVYQEVIAVTPGNHDPLWRGNCVRQLLHEDRLLIVRICYDQPRTDNAIFCYF